MPTYDYDCPRCGTFEVSQSIKADALTACPTCGSKRVRKLVSTGGGVIFTGSGFWETDYNRSKDYSAKKKSESGESPKPAAPAAAPAATPAKPAAATPAKPAAPTSAA